MRLAILTLGNLIWANIPDLARKLFGHKKAHVGIRTRILALLGGGSKFVSVFSLFDGSSTPDPQEDIDVRRERERITSADNKEKFALKIHNLTKVSGSSGGYSRGARGSPKWPDSVR